MSNKISEKEIESSMIKVLDEKHGSDCHVFRATKTDKQKLTDLLDGFGVGYGLKGDVFEYGDGRNYIKCNERKHQKVSGYSGFFTLFQFDKYGKFIEMGAWE